MAYGDKRGRKLPGEYAVWDYFSFAMAGAIGIIAATLTDLNQRGDASALYEISKWAVLAAEYMGLGQIQLWAVILLLMATGAGSIFFLQPLSMREAFLQGFGVLAVLMTVVPSDLGPPLNPPMENLPMPATEVAAAAQVASNMGRAGGVGVRGSIQTAAYSPGDQPELQTAALQDDPAMAGGYNVTLEINFPEGLRQEVGEMIRRGTMRGRVYNSATRKSYNLFRSGGANAQVIGDKLIIRTSFSGTDETSLLFARVETAGYRITVEEFEARQGNNPVWVINMTPSNVPLLIQRLNNSYWF